MPHPRPIRLRTERGVTYGRAYSVGKTTFPRAKVVISTTGLMWEQKGQPHSPLNADVEDVDILING